MLLQLYLEQDFYQLKLNNMWRVFVVEAIFVLVISTAWALLIFKDNEK